MAAPDPPEPSNELIFFNLKHLDYDQLGQEIQNIVGYWPSGMWPSRKTPGIHFVRLKDIDDASLVIARMRGRRFPFSDRAVQLDFKLPKPAPPNPQPQGRKPPHTNPQQQGRKPPHTNPQQQGRKPAHTNPQQQGRKPAPPNPQEQGPVVLMAEQCQVTVYVDAGDGVEKKIDGDADLSVLARGIGVDDTWNAYIVDVDPSMRDFKMKIGKIPSDEGLRDLGLDGVSIWFTKEDE